MYIYYNKYKIFVKPSKIEEKLLVLQEIFNLWVELDLPLALLRSKPTSLPGANLLIRRRRLRPAPPGVIY